MQPGTLRYKLASFVYGFNLRPRVGSWLYNRELEAKSQWHTGKP